MKDLPAEIYTNIFVYLKRKDLQTCCFVCKTWYRTAIQLSWEEVTLRTHNISLMKSDFNNLYHTQYLKYSRLIKTLAFEDAKNYGDPDKFDRKELLELLNLSPNLKVIDFSKTNYLEKYLGYLLDSDLQHIKRIYTGRDLRRIQSELVLSVYYKFRNSITCISLLYDRNTINLSLQQINILNSLNQFKKLKKLELHNKRDSRLAPFIIRQNSPNMEGLDFFSDPISESAMRHILDNNRRINLNFVSSLTRLDLFLSSLSATYTRHLLDYFPNQLTDLNIKIFHHNIFNWIVIVGMELALRLMEKSGRIDKTYIGFLGSEKYRVRDNNENNMTKYFKLLNSFRGTRQTHCTAHFNDAAARRIHVGYSFRYNSLGRLFVTYSLDKSDLQSDILVPDKTSSIIGPEIFRVLEFNLLSRYGGHAYRALKYSLSNCPGLQSLNVTYSTPESRHSSFSLKYKEGRTSSGQANCDFNVLQMEHTRPTKHFFDLVTAHLRNIEIVSVKTKDWGRTYYDNDPVIDLTGLKKLTRFKYTSTNNHLTKENKSFLIKYTNGTKWRILEYGKTEGMDNVFFTVRCDISVSLYFCEEIIKNEKR